MACWRECFVVNQFAQVPNSYILADRMEYPVGKKLPVWLVGMIY